MTDAKRAAVIMNPSKFENDADRQVFRAEVDGGLDRHGYSGTLWLETTVDDPGRAMARQALAEKVDLVVAAGGDGTVRVVAGEVGGTDTTFALLPMGTANLLARNLDIPSGLTKAVEVAAGGRDRQIDLVTLTADDGEPDHFVVMAGVGADAVVMEEANPKLKKVLGSAAYAVSAAQNAQRDPVKVSVQIDDEEPIEREAVLLLIGNVGTLQADVQLIPNAKPDDGLLDVLIASPQSKPQRLKLLAEVLFRRHQHSEDFDLFKARRVKITVEETEAYELDGDPEGHCRELRAEIVPGALTVRVPAEKS